MRAWLLIGMGLVVGIAGAGAHDAQSPSESFVLRAVGSRVIDYGLVFGASAGVQALTALTLGAPSADWFANESWSLSAWAAATMSAPMWTYTTLLVRSSPQSTIGHRATGLRVVTTNGEPISFTRSLARSAVMFAGWELAHIALFIPRNVATDTPAPWQLAGLLAATGYLVADIVTVIATGGQASIADLAVGTRLVRDR